MVQTYMEKSKPKYRQIKGFAKKHNLPMTFSWVQFLQRRTIKSINRRIANFVDKLNKLEGDTSEQTVYRFKIGNEPEYKLKQILKANNISGNFQVSLISPNFMMEEYTYTYSGIPSNGFSSFFNNNMYHDWISEFDYNLSKFEFLYQQTGMESDLTISMRRKVKLIKYEQSFAEGIGNCLLKPIQGWIREKINGSRTKRTRNKYIKIYNTSVEFAREFPGGIPENELQRISNELRVNINITNAVDSIVYISVKPGTRSQKTFNFKNTRLNHVEPDNIIDGRGLSVVYKTSKELEELKKTLKAENKSAHCKEYEGTLIQIITKNTNYKSRKLTKEIMKNGGLVQSSLGSRTITNCLKNTMDALRKEKVFFSYKRNRSGIYEVRTLKGKIVEYSLYHDMVIEFEEKTGLDQVICEYYQNEELSKFMLDGVHYTTSIQLNKRNSSLKLKHIDQEKAYAQFKSSQFYKGFVPVFTDFRRVDCQPIQFAFDNLGIYQINNIDLSECTDNIKKFLTKMNYLQNYNQFPSPELEFLNSIGVKFSLVAGIYGVSKLDFEFTKEMLNLKEGKVPFYAMYTGMCNRVVHKEEEHVEGPHEWFEHLASLGYEVQTYGNNVGKIITKKEKVYHKSHITAFITSYQRMNLLEQLFKIDYDNVVRIVTDGIYYHGDDPELIHKFRHKKSKYRNKPCAESFITNINRIQRNELYINRFSPFRKNVKHELFNDAGGVGKTYYNMKTDTGLIDPIYVCPPWRLALEKKKEFGCRANVYHYLLNVNKDEDYMFYKSNPSVIVCDECSQITNVTKLKIIRTFKHSKIIFMGDLSCQLGPCKGRVMDDEHLTINKSLTKNWRVKCPILLKKLNNLRKVIKKGHNRNEIYKYVIKKFSSRIITRQEAKNIYELEDYLLCSKHKYKNTWNKYFATKFTSEKKWRVYQNNNEHKNGEIILSKEKVKFANESYAETVHSVQGSTVKTKLLIDCRYIFSTRMLYTALSRAKYYDQIYLVYEDGDFHYFGTYTNVALEDDFEEPEDYDDYPNEEPEDYDDYPNEDPEDPGDYDEELEYEGPSSTDRPLPDAVVAGGNMNDRSTWSMSTNVYHNNLTVKELKTMPIRKVKDILDVCMTYHCNMDPLKKKFNNFYSRAPNRSCKIPDEEIPKLFTMVNRCVNNDIRLCISEGTNIDHTGLTMDFDVMSNDPIKFNGRIMKELLMYIIVSVRKYFSICNRSIYMGLTMRTKDSTKQENGLHKFSFHIEMPNFITSVAHQRRFITLLREDKSYTNIMKKMCPNKPDNMKYEEFLDEVVNKPHFLLGCSSKPSKIPHKLMNCIRFNEKKIECVNTTNWNLPLEFSMVHEGKHIKNSETYLLHYEYQLIKKPVVVHKPRLQISGCDNSDLNWWVGQIHPDRIKTRHCNTYEGWVKTILAICNVYKGDNLYQYIEDWCKTGDKFDSKTPAMIRSLISKETNGPKLGYGWLKDSIVDIKQYKITKRHLNPTADTKPYKLDPNKPLHKYCKV